MASFNSIIFVRFARQVWLMNHRRGLKTSLQLQDKTGFLQSPTFRQIKDLGYAPKFKDEQVKKRLRNPYFSRRDWFKNSKHAIAIAWAYCFYKFLMYELEMRRFDMELLKDSVFISQEDALMDKYEEMYTKEIERVFAENGVQ